MNDTPNFDLALGQIIREYRERLGLSRKQLAAIIGGSESHIKAIESRTRNPTIMVFVLLPAALGIDAHAFFLIQIMSGFFHSLGCSQVNVKKF